jgi:phage regulator Rha-like protein
MNTNIININTVQTMTSLEIAELTGKQHKNVMQAIRNMEPAWEKVQGLKFQLSSRIYNLPNGGTKEVPCYVLTKTECLYIATKFNDEARAKLVLRWEELEREQALGGQSLCNPLRYSQQGQSPCALPSPQKKQCPNWPQKSKKAPLAMAGPFGILNKGNTFCPLTS